MDTTRTRAQAHVGCWRHSAHGVLPRVSPPRARVLGVSWRCRVRARGGSGQGRRCSTGGAGGGRWGAPAHAGVWNKAANTHLALAMRNGPRPRLTCDAGMTKCPRWTLRRQRSGGVRVSQQTRKASAANWATRGGSITEALLNVFTYCQQRLPRARAVHCPRSTTGPAHAHARTWGRF